jgi:hypothetical protein
MPNSPLSRLDPRNLPTEASRGDDNVSEPLRTHAEVQPWSNATLSGRFKSAQIAVGHGQPWLKRSDPGKLPRLDD